MRDILTIITPTIRPAGALEVARSIQAANPHPLEIRHLIAYWPEAPDYRGERIAPWADQLLASVQDGWLMWVDDDNRLHPDLPRRLAELIPAHPDAGAFVFDMQYPGFPDNKLIASPHRVVPGSIDGGQAVLWYWFAREVKWPAGALADGRYLQTLHQARPDAFHFVSESLTYHNHQVWASEVVV